jgi:urease accessory protein
MSLDIALSAHSKYFGWEILCFGRRASGESWRRGTSQMRTSIRRADRVLWSEVAALEACSGFAQSTVGLAGCTVCGTFLVAGDDVENELLKICRHVRPALAAARTALPGCPAS